MNIYHCFHWGRVGLLWYDLTNTYGWDSVWGKACSDSSLFWKKHKQMKSGLFCIYCKHVLFCSLFVLNYGLNRLYKWKNLCSPLFFKLYTSAHCGIANVVHPLILVKLLVKLLEVYAALIFINGLSQGTCRKVGTIFSFCSWWNHVLKANDSTFVRVQVHRDTVPIRNQDSWPFTMCSSY